MQTPWQTPAPQAGQQQQRQLRLVRGQVLTLWLPADTVILSQASRLQVACAPQWLGGRLHYPRQELEDGQVMLSRHAGWIELQAPQGGSVLCLWQERLPWSQRVLRGWTRLFARHIPVP